MKKIKILIYSGHCEVVGGDAKHLFDLVNNLDTDRFDIEVFTDKNHLFEERAKQWLKRDIPIHYLDTRPELFKKGYLESLYDKIASYSGTSHPNKFVFRLLNYKLCGYSIYKWIMFICARISFTSSRYTIHNAMIFYRLFKDKRGAVDIFHFNNGGYPGKECGLIAVVMARLCGIKKTVMSVNNSPAKRRWYKISDHVFDFFISRYCTRITAASEISKKKMNNRRKIPIRNVTRIFTGLPEGRTFSEEDIANKRNELNLRADVPLLLISGNVDEERKGHAVLFKSMINVVDKYPSTILLVVGDGSKKAELMELRDRYGLHDNIVFLAHRSDIEEINSLIDIAVVPSIGFEAVPYTIKEAMRAGKPVITTDAGGCPEAVYHDVNGLVVPQGDSDALAKAILQLLRDKDVRLIMGAKGKKIFNERFLLSEIIHEQEDVYGQILAL